MENFQMTPLVSTLVQVVTTSSESRPLPIGLGRDVVVHVVGDPVAIEFGSSSGVTAVVPTDGSTNGSMVLPTNIPVPLRLSSTDTHVAFRSTGSSTCYLTLGEFK
jgi:heme/copper-type cytochrome/quinol oxidase subunit 2